MVNEVMSNRTKSNEFSLDVLGTLMQSRNLMYNPYELLQITVNGKPIDARPCEFSGEIVSQNDFTDDKGRLVVPTKLSTVCPDCGRGLFLEVEFKEPPFEHDCQCPDCHPEPVQAPDPFMNPVEEGRIPYEDLDPLQQSDEQLEEEDSSLADRLNIKQPDEAPSSHTTSAVMVKDEEKPKAVKKTAKKKAPKKKAAKKTAKKVEKKPEDKSTQAVKDAAGVEEKPKEKPEEGADDLFDILSEADSLPESEDLVGEKFKKDVEPAQDMGDEIDLDDLMELE
jgi:hypothetical protein